MICAPLERQRPRRLREEPVEADHHADADAAMFEDAETGVAGQEWILLVLEQMRLTIDLKHPVSIYRDGRVVQPSLAPFGETGHDHTACPLCELPKRGQKGAGAIARLRVRIKIGRGCDHIARIRQLRQHQQIGSNAVQETLHRRHIGRHVIADGTKLNKPNREHRPSKTFARSNV